MWLFDPESLQRFEEVIFPSGMGWIGMKWKEMGREGSGGDGGGHCWRSEVVANEAKRFSGQNSNCQPNITDCR